MENFVRPMIDRMAYGIKAKTIIAFIQLNIVEWWCLSLPSPAFIPPKPNGNDILLFLSWKPISTCGGQIFVCNNQSMTHLERSLIKKISFFHLEMTFWGWDIDLHPWFQMYIYQSLLVIIYQKCDKGLKFHIWYNGKKTKIAYNSKPIHIKSCFIFFHSN